MGTRSRHLEHHLKTEAKHKHMILLLNKCDLVGFPRRCLISKLCSLHFVMYALSALREKKRKQRRVSCRNDRLLLGNDET